MTLLTYIQHPRYAQAFVDYLKTLGVAVQARAQGGSVAIVLEDDRQLDQAQAELKRFLAEPDHERYRQASWEVEDDGGAAQRLNPVYRGASLVQLLRQGGLVTNGIFLVCLAVFIYTNQGADGTARAPLLFFHDLESMANSGQYWRWITPALLHFGIVHFSFNLFSWWVFGGIIERAQSATRLLGIFLACAVVGNGIEFFWNRDNFGGLSGVVYGLLGYLWFYGRFNPQAPIRLPSGMVIFMLAALVLGFSNILPVANMAHLGGLLTGCLLGLCLAKLDQLEE